MPAYDANKDSMRGVSSPTNFGRKSRVITPSDEDNLDPYPKAILVTSAGSLAYVPGDNADADPVELDSVPCGFVPPHSPIRMVLATGTTATVCTIED